MRTGKNHRGAGGGPHLMTLSIFVFRSAGIEVILWTLEAWSWIFFMRPFLVRAFVSNVQSMPMSAHLKLGMGTTTAAMGQERFASPEIDGTAPAASVSPPRFRGTAPESVLRRHLGDCMVLQFLRSPASYVLCHATDLADLVTRTNRLRRVEGVTDVQVSLNREVFVNERMILYRIEERIRFWERARRRP